MQKYLIVSVVWLLLVPAFALVSTANRIHLDALVDFDGEESSTKVTRFANYLRIVLPCQDAVVMVAAARAIGRLAHSGGTLTNDFVDFEVKRALSPRFNCTMRCCMLVSR